MAMESSLLSIRSLVAGVKTDIFNELMENNNLEAFVSASAYDTAWLAMIPLVEDNEKVPMFPGCLNWIVRNQKESGFWGETDDQDLPTIDALTSTLACLIALKTWNVGHSNIESGLMFISSKAEIVLKMSGGKLPRWFMMTFPAMVELATEAGLRVVFPPGLDDAIAQIFLRRHHILQTEEVDDQSRCFPPLISYMEALPLSYRFDRQETVSRYLSGDGSLFQSPSATAQAFMSTSNAHSLKYLQSLLHKFPNGGVPAKYPVDGELIKLSVVDHVQGLGVAAHFNQEIDTLLSQLYSEKNSNPSATNDAVPLRLFKDALAFRLLRVRGHLVNSGSFCWFVHEPETTSYMEENREEFISAMYSVYRATDLAFPGEKEMEKARFFATKLLQNIKTRQRDHNLFITKGLRNMIKYELDVPWTARLDRLYHRKWIEENQTSPLRMGKASFYRLSCLDNTKLMQAAVENFEFMQCVYVRELEELKGWSKKWRLSEMGFGREKTVYTYFAVASCSLFPHNSIMRLLIAKAAIIVTVADDFYDMEASLPELEILTLAVQRWESEGLEGDSKTIFHALDDFVNHIAAECYPLHQTQVLPKLRNLWRECFVSWMVERRWSMAEHRPAMDEYLETGMTSIAVHAIALPATTLLNGDDGFEYHNITKLLMAIARLANDTQSYQKEVDDGKMNLVVLHSHENPGATIEDSVAYVEDILEQKRKEFLKHVFTDGGMPSSCKQTHLYCMKVFEMFYNSANLFDSETTLVEDVKKSIYLPIRRSRPLKTAPSSDKSKVSAGFQLHAIPRTSNTTTLIKNSSVSGRRKVQLPLRLNLSFVGLPL